MKVLSVSEIASVSGGGIWSDVLEIAGGVITTASGSAMAIIAGGSIIASDGVTTPVAAIGVTAGTGMATVGVAMIVDGSNNLAHQ